MLTLMKTRTFSGYMEMSRPVGIASRSKDTRPPEIFHPIFLTMIMIINMIIMIIMITMINIISIIVTVMIQKRVATCRSEEREKNTKVADSVGEEPGKWRSEDKQNLEDDNSDHDQNDHDHDDNCTHRYDSIDDGGLLDGDAQGLHVEVEEGVEDGHGGGLEQEDKLDPNLISIDIKFLLGIWIFRSHLEVLIMAYWEFGYVCKY